MNLVAAIILLILVLIERLGLAVVSVDDLHNEEQ